MIAVLSMAGKLPPLFAARPGAIDLGRNPATDRTLSVDDLSTPSPLACLRLLLGDAKIEGVVLVVDENARFGDAELALLAAEAWRKPVVVCFGQEPGEWREPAAKPENVVSFAHGRRQRTLRALSGMGVAVAASPTQVGAEMKQALELRASDRPAAGASWDFASAIRWVDRNVY